MAFDFLNILSLSF